jgi:hypothetical protein
MSETETTSTRKRSSSKASDEAATAEEGVASSYEEALEVGYLGGPVDEVDHTLAGEAAAEAEAAKAESEAASE